MRRFAAALAGAAFLLLCPAARAADAPEAPAPDAVEAPPRPKPRAVEAQIHTGPAGSASSWRGDGTIGQSLKLGARFNELVAIDVLGRVSYGSVDTRMVTYLSLGATLYGRIGKNVRPFGRLAFVHQHEEPLSAVRHDAFGALFGVGDGIRHRSGFGKSLGAEIIVKREGRNELVFAADANGSWFPDPRGPTFYLGGGLWIGVNYSL
jgi:hypothetical protein